MFKSRAVSKAVFLIITCAVWSWAAESGSDAVVAYFTAGR